MIIIVKKKKKVSPNIFGWLLIYLSPAWSQLFPSLASRGLSHRTSKHYIPQKPRICHWLCCTWFWSHRPIKAAFKLTSLRSLVCPVNITERLSVYSDCLPVIDPENYWSLFPCCLPRPSAFLSIYDLSCQTWSMPVTMTNECMLPAFRLYMPDFHVCVYNTIWLVFLTLSLINILQMDPSVSASSLHYLYGLPK